LRYYFSVKMFPIHLRQDWRQNKTLACMKVILSKNTKSMSESREEKGESKILKKTGNQNIKRRSMIGSLGKLIGILKDIGRLKRKEIRKRTN
jgi:hypothetical protein